MSPHAGGSKIPPSLQAEIRSRIERHAKRKFAGAYNRIDVRFRGALCYVDVFTEPEPPAPKLLRALGETLKQYQERLRSTPTHLCRLRYFSGRNGWSLALYTYSQERYEPCLLPNGEHFGTVEKCFALAASFYLGDHLA
jgi:hypothetical protein